MSQSPLRTMIVPAPFQALAQGLCEAVAEGDAGAGMFATGLSANGSLPATHYISSGHISEFFAALLPLTTLVLNGESVNQITTPGSVEAVEALAAQAGITLPPGTIAALFAAIDVSEQGPWEAMARLGVAIVQEAI